MDKQKKDIIIHLLKVAYVLLIISMLGFAVHISTENEERTQEMHRERCLNGVYNPCNPHCRSFWGAITGRDGCDELLKQDYEKRYEKWLEDHQ